MKTATVDAATLAGDIAHRCERATYHAAGASWSACCPAHDDRHASLSISWDQDKVLLHCHAGCGTAAIVQALGLTMADLFVASPGRRNGKSPTVHVYDYVDLHGQLVHQTVRYAPKAFRQRRPDPAKPGDYLWNLRDIEPVLFHLPLVRAAVHRADTIYLVEGEKDAETLSGYGLTASCNPMGAGKWRQSYSEALRGAHVAILPDNDEAGRKHADLVARSLHGIAASIKVVHLPDLPDHGDVTDWLNTGMTVQDLAAHVRITPVWTPNRLSSYSSSGDAQNATPHTIRPKGLNSLSSLSSYPEWPTLAPDAFYGLAGDIVGTIAPHSEADPVALLMQLLEYFGVSIGRSAYYQVEATKHYTNLNCCLVGPTSKARKGTAYDHIERIMETVDTSWTLANVSGGCGSGEGLIAAVRDKTMKREPIKVRGKVTGYEEVETDPGVIDKRLLVYEAEFSSVLKIAGREGNILSEILRKAWDTGHLRNTVKNNPLKATGAHIAIIGHITIEEVQRTLTTTDAANGFGNRFLWLCVKRSKLLPDGGALHSIDFNPLLERLRAVFTKAKALQHMRRDAAAQTAWRAVYALLSEERPGLVGSLLARAEAQVVRLSMLYALLDGVDTIGAQHLYAALALWEYVEASVAYIFGKSMGDPVADTLLTALQNSYPQGLSRKHILEETFQGNTRADELDRVLRLLHRRNLITLAEVPPEGGRGRPKQVVTFRLNELNELNELNHGTYLSMSKDAVRSMQERATKVGAPYELNPAGPSSCPHTQTMETDNAVVCQDCGEYVGEVL